MPLLRFDVIEGRSKEELKKLLDTCHEAMVDAFGVPERDRYQIVHQHRPEEMMIEDTGLGYPRTKDLVVISVVSKQRTKEQKEQLYAQIAERIEKECGVAKTDVMISIVENGDADWSFGMGEAQFIRGLL
ncbi:tautomerase family protein [Bacillus sp. S2(2019)]|uniref:tautomerase family protein n=1 Tax=unclassified Bacillus (in: firmicutes) TaxID=185979 RepID=UPI0010AE53BE|nr:MULTISPECIES: tautomerase family protein [unclassified Bacillus (in: firmicutes)]MBW3702164.1 tautomerase family protein [Bacillus aerophilus]TKD59371.1 tautomerase family protein [Bacillus sp. S2(2019)]